MNSPTFLIGEIIYSDKLQGRIEMAHWMDGIGWSYILVQSVVSAQYDMAQIKESDVIAVWRNGRWTGK